ncbi:hypothetical protein [Streptosporangium roseum]|nr:hypothetical protein [Streptosporangium roseum]
MRKPHAQSGGLFDLLGVYTQDTGPDCAGTLLNHNGSMRGYGTLIYSTPDGRKTLHGYLKTGTLYEEATAWPHHDDAAA